MALEPQTTNAYSGAEIVAIYAGFLLEQLGDGDDAISIEPATEAVTSRIGLGGSAVVSIQQDLSANVRIRCLRGSPANTVLQRELNLQRSTGVGKPLLLKDPRGKEVHACDQAFVMQQPQSQHGKNASDVEWTIHCPVLRSNQGGY